MEEKVRIQDDLYEAVNGEWLKNAVIPDDRPTTGGFAVLDEDVEKLLMSDLAAFAKGEKSSDVEGVSDAVRLYCKVLDTKRRNEDGIKPVMGLLDEIKDLKNAAELNIKAKELLIAGACLPFICGVETDMQDATKNSFYLHGPGIILPDTTYYGTEKGKALLDIYCAAAAEALSKTDLSAEEQKQFIEDTVAFDALVAKKVKSQLEWADYVKNYNPMAVEETAGYLQPFDLKEMLEELYGTELPEEIIVYDPKAIKEFEGYFNEETFPLYVHWAYVKTLLGKCALLSEELFDISTKYRRALLGVPNNPALDKQAYQVASRLFSEPLGVYYGRTYFGEEAKKDIVSLVKSIIEEYKLRMKTNTFLKEETKEKAILKLSTIAIKMGYPDGVRDFYKNLKVNDQDSYYEASQKILKARCMEELERLHKPVDRSEWLMPGHMVNACYDPNRNDITFPAAILQKPFYSLHQSVSENLGGIGTVIAHEISHAFDNNGAQFDENGNLKNWWTEEDYAAFKKLTQDMIEEWDGIEYGGGKVNGELVVSENIADNGGMAVTLAIMHHTEGADFSQYFKNWAKIWCLKAKPEYIQFLLVNDVHSPAKLRANVQVRNFPEWYETFGVTASDEMYIAPEKRIIIW